MKRLRRVSVCSVVVLVSAFAAAQSRPSVDSVVVSLGSVWTYPTAVISPTGGRIALAAKQTLGARHGESRTSIISVIPASGGGPPSTVTSSEHPRAFRQGDLAWSPDGGRLAFLSDTPPPFGKRELAFRDQFQIYLASPPASPRRLTSVRGQLQHLQWSPDGRSIAFLFTEGSKQEPGALGAYKPDIGVVGEEIETQRIAVVDVTTGRMRLVSPEGLYVYEYDWSPDGRRFAATAAEGSGTNEYWLARLYTISADSGERREIWKPTLQLACPRWSPDGSSIAVIHGLMSDFGSNGGDVWIVPVSGGEARNLTPEIPSSPNEIFFRSANEILFTEQLDGGYGIAKVDPASGRIETLWTGEEVLHLSVARSGVASAAVRSSFQSPPEVWAGSIGKWSLVTHTNTAKPFWGEAKSLRWESDGHRVQGWLLFPRDFDPNRRYPMAVSVHGGPSAANGAGWPARWNAVLPSQGYFVFLPNPRGSFGRGEAFTQGNVKDFGYGDWRDILAGVDAALTAAPIDPNRVGLMGWSYGGYMTMWGVTQTNRFRAAVAGAGIVNWQSYYGQNRIDKWMLPFFGKSVYEDPAVYAKSSPITFIQRVKTPTLVLHGDRDSEVPTPQGYEFWHALKTLGVPTQLVVYENEGHGIRKPDHVIDIARRTVAWFDKYLK